MFLGRNKKIAVLGFAFKSTEGVLSCSTQLIVFAGTGFLYLAVNWQGTVIYNPPYMPPVIYRVIFQPAAALEFFEHHLADMRK